MVRLVVYGAFGWCMEILWTASYALVTGVRGDLGGDSGQLKLSREQRLRLLGHTYVWMFPLYGAGGLLFEPIHEAIRGWPWLGRGALWMVLIFVVEYVAGAALCRLTGRCPWDYSYSRYHLHGLIRFDYMPVWFLFGLVLERFHDAVAAM
ncbi:putative ABC transporter permease [Nannocystis bainbridge]|uniref:ABC-transporter type IV n=1 Tax=Nannocystis bainbridge TaxID=2995303 RepID=A0ABT5DTD4_9BACT|nr:hypothetical protein [Nannocystis bainbridge]MDC0716796.1 hypothetical protein [Nannocystis bainbridge]